MSGSISRAFAACLGAAALCALPTLATAADRDASSDSALAGWTFGYSPYTYHFSDAKKEHDYEPDNEKHSYVWLVNAEKQFDEHQLAGLALFSNSFGQFTQYAYYGWQFRPFDNAPQLFFKITGGVIHGYKYPYHKKIPLNNKNGWGFTAIPAVGWNFNQNWGAQVNVLGNSAMMFQLNYTMR